MTALSHPFDWHLHLVWFLVVAALYGSFLWATRAQDRRPTARQYLFFTMGTVVLLVALTWPLGDLAAHWSLLTLVLQRLLLMLAVPPLLVMGTPVAVIAALTRPAPIDAVVRVAVRPAPAVAIVTVVAVGTLTTGAVSLATSSSVGRAVVQVVVLLAGFVLWAPVFSQFPGTRHLSSVGKAGYLIVQSIVPSFLSVVWIFARRPLYPAYSHHSFAGMSPLLDQQLAGFLAKLSTIAVLWTVAFVTMSRAKVLDGAEVDEEPLIWSDVEREIERADRRQRWSKWLPPSGDQGESGGAPAPPPPPG